MGLRLVVISTLFLGALIIQVTSQMILPLSGLYVLFLLTYGLSLLYLGLYLRRVSTRAQSIVQLLGDVVIVTGFVYVTGGLYSPFSFLYLTVIAVAASLLRGGGFIFAGTSALAYGLLVDLMVFRLIEIPPNLAGIRVAPAPSRVLYQLMIHVVGFILVAALVSFLAESLRSTRNRLEEERARTTQFAALTKHVVRSVGAGIVATDLDGAVLHLNPAAVDILGIGDAETAVGSAIADLMPLQGHRWDLELARARNRNPARLEARLTTTNAGIGFSVGPLEDERGELVGFVVNFRDLTEIEIEAEGRRLQDRMAAVGEVASRMAHEIKNPLASISGSCQVLGTAQGLDDTHRRLLKIVVDESHRLSEILDGFLTYARPQPRSIEPCDIGALLGDCMDLLRRSVEIRPHHRLTLDLASDLTVVGDRNLLSQVFWNLSRNAVQAMPDGGELRISGRHREGWIVLSWRDSGVGMDEATRTRAFEPFVTTHEHGTGLGLAVVYAAVEKHRGTIDIDSAPGRGTTVTIELPAEAESA